MTYDHNQLEVPESFVALSLVRGRLPPSATREAVNARYELCEGVAASLEPAALALHLDRGIAQAEVLAECGRGLLDASSGLGPAEAEWVVRRLAELLGWSEPP